MTWVALTVHLVNVGWYALPPMRMSTVADCVTLSQMYHRLNVPHVAQCGVKHASR